MCDKDDWLEVPPQCPMKCRLCQHIGSYSRANNLIVYCSLLAHFGFITDLNNAESRLRNA
jgi:hypothetical protein